MAYKPLSNPDRYETIFQMKRKLTFTIGEIYHICNKSISSYSIFRKESYSERFLDCLAYYDGEPKISFSKYVRLRRVFQYRNIIQLGDPPFKILAYCIMPDHYHLLLSPEKSANISNYIGTVENSYTRFYNTKNNRRGPLWQSRFRCVRIVNNEQLLHVSRYIHLNPVTADLVKEPQNWEFSSYKFYLNQSVLDGIRPISIRTSEAYERFVLDNKDYQRKLKWIKRQMKDD